MLADSHTHILDPRLVNSAEEIVRNMDDDRLAFIVETSASVSESQKSVPSSDCGLQPARMK